MNLQSLLSPPHMLNAWLLIVPAWLTTLVPLRGAQHRGSLRAADTSWYTANDALVSTAGMVSLFLFMGVSLFVRLEVSSVFFGIGLSLVLAGVAGHRMAKRAFASADDAAMARRGVYRISRNPMYTSILLMLGGAALAAASPVLAFIWLCVASLMHLIIRSEECNCLKLYGESYRTYMKTVPRYLIWF